MKFISLIICLTLLAGCRTLDTADETINPPFHTTPDKWEEPRIFQSPFEDQWADRINIEKIFVEDSVMESEGKLFSPNQAYWFLANMSDTSQPGPFNCTVYVYNERDYLTCLIFTDIISGGVKPQWISEKLLYVRVWLGRVLGIDLIFDVESEQVIYREMTNWGGIAFQQWQQAKTRQTQ